MGNKWILKTKNYVEGKYRLFCLPYAGGGAGIYRNWQQYFDDRIEVCPIQLPGRENRMNEMLIDDAMLLSQMIVRGLMAYQDKPFSIFGYSAGGILAYEMAKLTKKIWNNSPDGLFMGATTLDFSYQKDSVCNKGEDEFIQYLLELGGTNEESIKSQEFRKVFMPIIRNDYKMTTDYKCSGVTKEFPICAFASKEDEEVPYAKTLELKDYTMDFEIHDFEGKHFFINEHQEKMCQIINDIILERFLINEL